ncbi:hemK methyltransferase family member 1 [Lates japonicus]|uniref:HemK methyltransferase family member 1 n=1 Tax=Lates japonicus TaxID=270547 RepID=A0AAD3NAK8_LATJO|nr:hemK methyltransferase family member 1 [Lates japonicus]
MFRSPITSVQELVELVLSDLEMKPGRATAGGSAHVWKWDVALVLFLSSLLKSLPQMQSQLSLCSSVSAVVSNPHYLFSGYGLVGTEISRFEDHSALDGGTDGLKVIKQILTLAPQILTDSGRVYLELDPRHPPLVRRWAEANVGELRFVETWDDITGRPRFCILQKREVKQGP